MSFFSSLGSALKRAFTLPSDRNSLSDILGPDVDKALKATAKSLIEDAAYSAVVAFAGTVSVGTKGLSAAVSAAIHSKLDGVSPALSVAIDQQVASALSTASSVAVADAEALSGKVVSALEGLLKL